MHSFPSRTANVGFPRVQDWCRRERYKAGTDFLYKNDVCVGGRCAVDVRGVARNFKYGITQ